MKINALGKLNYIVRDKQVPNCLWSKVYNQRVILAITYGCDTLSLIKRNAQRWARAQRAHKKQMPGIKLINKKRNTWIRQQTKVIDIFRKN